MPVSGPIRPAAGHGPAATECEHSHGVLITRTEPDRRLGAALRARASASLRAQIGQFGVDVIGGVGFVVRFDERTSRESLWLVTGRPAAARVEDLDTFASPLKGALGAGRCGAGAAWLEHSCRRLCPAGPVQVRQGSARWVVVVSVGGHSRPGGAGAWRAAVWPLSCWPCTRHRGKSVSGLVP